MEKRTQHIWSWRGTNLQISAEGEFPLFSAKRENGKNFADEHQKLICLLLLFY